MQRWFLLSAVACACSLPVVAADDGKLRERIDDKHAKGNEWWVYNDLQLAREIARKENKPLFVTFRCVPCKDCAAFDAEVAKGSGMVEKLAREKFIPVRQVEMKGVDLSQFQFDYDLNWAAIFINADGTVYARYGTQSAAGADAYNSVEGLIRTMDRVLELHANYPRNKAELAGKRGEAKPYKTAVQMPGLENKQRYVGATTRRNCIHCHNIHDAENNQAQSRGKLGDDLLYRYPLPDNVGLIVDANHGLRIKQVTAGSPAAAARVKAGSALTHLNGQAMTSIADMQWVLHGLSSTGATLTVRTSGGESTLKLPAGWKKSDISWRGSMHSISPRFRVWAPEIKPTERKRLGIGETKLANQVRWINTGSPSGRAARNAGLRNGDVIVSVAGKTGRMSPPQLQMYLKLNHKVGQTLSLEIIRGRQRKMLQLKLVE